jgi:antitoxin HicB
MLGLLQLLPIIMIQSCHSRNMAFPAPASDCESAKNVDTTERKTMLAYPVTLTPDRESGGFVVSFPDIPEALTQGETIEEALRMAQDALESALDFYFEDRRAIPTPSKATFGQHLVELPASIAAKVLRLNQ